jgi:hypothetical protein
LRKTSKRKWRAGAAFASSISLFGALLLPGNSASAAVTSEPVTIAVGRSGDGRVLQIGGDGTSNSAPIVAASYVSAVDTASSKQRWTLERVTGSGMPAFAYRIKNPATGKCLNSSGATPVNKAPIILYTCNGTLSGTNEIWWVDTSPSPDGVRIRNKRDNRCLDITGGSAADGAPLESYTCNEADSAWNQLFLTRTGSFDCAVRDSDWQVTAGICVRQQGQTSGVMGIWFNAPSAMAYRDPEDYILSNERRTRISADVVNGLNEKTGDVQMGWRALRAPTSAGSVSYNAYWQEYGQNTEEYHAISTVDPAGSPNGSNIADGMQHTYMMTASTTSSQWDLYYDFNFVATTARQSRSRANFVRADLQSRYIDALTQAQPFEFRVQTINIAGVWVKPDLAWTALGNNKECGMFPTWADFSEGAGNNQPPWCLSTARTLTDAKTTVDTLKVAKPTSAVSKQSQNTVPDKSLQPAQGTVNGVDQKLLSNCMATDPSRCLQEVPGLQRCVQQHLRCYTPQVAVSESSTTGDKSVTKKETIRAAQALIHPSTPKGAAKLATTPPEAELTTLAQARLTDEVGTRIPADTAVFVVTGRDQVRSWSAESKKLYGKWKAVIDAKTAEVLYARLES